MLDPEGTPPVPDGVIVGVSITRRCSMSGRCLNMEATQPAVLVRPVNFWKVLEKVITLKGPQGTPAMSTCEGSP